MNAITLPVFPVVLDGRREQLMVDAKEFYDAVCMPALQDDLEEWVLDNCYRFGLESLVDYIPHEEEDGTQKFMLSMHMARLICVAEKSDEMIVYLTREECKWRVEYVKRIRLI